MKLSIFDFTSPAYHRTNIQHSEEQSSSEQHHINNPRDFIRSNPFFIFLLGLLMGSLFYHVCGSEIVSTVMIDGGVILILLGLIILLDWYCFKVERKHRRPLN